RLAVGEALEQAVHDRDAAAAGEAGDEDVVARRLELEPEVERLEGALLPEGVELVDRAGRFREGGRVAAPPQLVGREAERLGGAHETARTARAKSLRPSGTSARPSRVQVGCCHGNWWRSGWGMRPRMRPVRSIRPATASTAPLGFHGKGGSSLPSGA